MIIIIIKIRMMTMMIIGTTIIMIMIIIITTTLTMTIMKMIMIKTCQSLYKDRRIWNKIACYDWYNRDDVMLILYEMLHTCSIMHTQRSGCKFENTKHRCLGMFCPGLFWTPQIIRCPPVRVSGYTQVDKYSSGFSVFNWRHIIHTYKHRYTSGTLWHTTAKGGWVVKWTATDIQQYSHWTRY